MRQCAGISAVLAFELGPMFAPNGEIFDEETFRRLMDIPEIKGVKHSSLDRMIELERLALRDAHRPDFRIYTGNDRARIRKERNTRSPTSHNRSRSANFSGARGESANSPTRTRSCDAQIVSCVDAKIRPVCVSKRKSLQLNHSIERRVFDSFDLRNVHQPPKCFFIKNLTVRSEHRSQLETPAHADIPGTLPHMPPPSRRKIFRVVGSFGTRSEFHHGPQ